MVKKLIALFRQTFQEMGEDNVPRLAAALSYFTVFSLAPLLVVVIAVASLAFDQQVVTGRLDEQIQGLVGREGADMVQEMLRNAQRPAETALATVLGVVTLLLGAAGAFGALQDALNTVWGVKPKPGGVLKLIKERFISFTMVLGVGFLLLVSLVISAVIAGINGMVLERVPEAQFLLQVVQNAVSFGITMLLFALIYKILPDIEIKWRDVWVGAAFTALLFTIGKFLIGLYLGNSGITSTYGSAGALVIILLWVFYSAQILLFGAEFTQVYAHMFGSRASSAKGAVTAAVQPLADLPEAVAPVTATASLSTPATTSDALVSVPSLATPDLPPPVDAGQVDPPHPAPRWGDRVLTVFGAGSALISFVVGLVVGRERRARR